MKCISSIKKQPRVPHILLSVCTDIDIEFAIANIEYLVTKNHFPYKLIRDWNMLEINILVF